MTDTHSESGDRGQLVGMPKVGLGVVTIAIVVLIVDQLLKSPRTLPGPDTEIVCNCAGPWWQVWMAPIALTVVGLFIIAVDIIGGARPLQARYRTRFLAHPAQPPQSL